MAGPSDAEGHRAGDLGLEPEQLEVLVKRWPVGTGDDAQTAPIFRHRIQIERYLEPFVAQLRPIGMQCVSPT